MPSLVVQTAEDGVRDGAGLRGVLAENQRGLRQPILPVQKMQVVRPTRTTRKKKTTDSLLERDRERRTKKGREDEARERSGSILKRDRERKKLRVEQKSTERRRRLFMFFRHPTKEKKKRRKENTTRQGNVATKK